MTRFDATDPTERRKLFADAVRAHRQRGSAFCTVESARTDADGEDDPLPWVQFADRTFNLDCTDDELDRLTDLLEDFPEFRVEAMESPDDADGTNVRVTARSDENRLAAFVDRVFRTVYERPDDYRAWVTAV
jgi:hypothetical protein